MQVFSTNCTLPSDGVTFVGAPHIRGTLVLHLNVPPQSTIEPGNWAQKFERTAMRAWTKVKWMLFTLLAPEFALGKAFSDFLSVRCLKSGFEAFSKTDGVPWSAAHTHFANMGGFTINFAPLANTTTHEHEQQADEMRHRGWSVLGLKRSVSAPAYLEHITRYLPHVVENPVAQIQPLNTEMVFSPREQHHAWIEDIWKTFETDNWDKNLSPPGDLEQCETRRSWAVGKTDWLVDNTNTAIVDSSLQTLDMSYFRNECKASRFIFSKGDWARNVNLLRGNIWILDANQLLMAREFGIIDKLPFLAPDDLDDRNKQDMFLKLLALGQISWFILEICSRFLRHLSVSLLEVMVLAFALCTIVIYLFLLSKPNNATYSITIPAARHPQTAHEVVRLALVGPATSWWFRGSPWIPNDAIHLDHRLAGPKNDPGHQLYTAYGSAACALVFGAAHCIAWNFKFPTDIEKVMWHEGSP
ncbi:hypothetical protein PG991_001864 [Apiospora marii]|uniref:Uncharacterized protein n=1 Tax=Apiospora marii TaxID=335849 RepID=A0ABR1SN81_9PEZI